MSWVSQQARRQQGSWVASMPRPGLAGFQRSQAQSCPLVGLVGACCSGCAEGKGCGAKEELEHHHAQTPIVGETAIPWSNVQKSNATIQTVQEAAAALASSPAGSPELLRYTIWSLFYTTWTVWYAAAEAQVESDWLMTGLMFGSKTLHGDMVDTYEKLILSFNEQLGALDQLGVKASADPIDTRSPAGKAFDATIKGVLSGAGGALAGIGTALTYVAVAGAIGLGLYFGGPLLLRLVRKK